MTWEFEITGDAWVLEQLSQALQSEAIRIVNQEGAFKLIGHMFDGIDGHDKARRSAQEQLDKISGLAFLDFQLKAPLQIRSVASCEEDGSGKNFYVSLKAATVEVHMSCIVSDAQGNIISKDPSPESLRASFNLAALDKSVDKVLRLLGGGDLSWLNLYRLYEIVRDDVGSDKVIVSRSWCQSDNLRLFRWTANHPEASGDNARHGSLSQSAPKKPMELAQAQALIRTLVQKWLQKNLKMVS